MGTIDLVTARTKEQIIFCKDVLFSFRTNLDETTYIDQIMCMINNENFTLVYIPNRENTAAAAFVGYRFMHTLRTNRMIYVDDLFTHPEYRGIGYAGSLLDFVDQEARKAQIESIHLDSGYMLYDAHRLYLNKGYVLACNHFAKKMVLSL